MAVQISALFGVCRSLSANIVIMSGMMGADITAAAVDLTAYQIPIFMMRRTIESSYRAKEMKTNQCRTEDDCPTPMWCRGKNKCPRAEEKADDRLGATACSPSLDCPHDELVAYIKSMKGGERVMEMGGSCMVGRKGTVEVRDSGVCIRWDYAKFADGAGCLITSFTGGARIIPENSQADQR